jgi:hypothetical protein
VDPADVGPWAESIRVPGSDFTSAGEARKLCSGEDDVTTGVPERVDHDVGVGHSSNTETTPCSTRRSICS